MNKEKKCLFIHSVPLNGGYGGSKRTYQNYTGLMSNYICDDYYIEYIPNKIKSFLNAIIFGLRSITIIDEIRIANMIKKGHYDFVFLNSSLFGHLAKLIRKKYPNMMIYIHFHNYEKKFYEDWSYKKNILYKIVSKIAYYNEKMSAKYSNNQIFISKEDKSSVCSEYKINLDNSIIIPVALKDYYTKSSNTVEHNPYVLFLGSNFYANNKAVEYLINNVAPFVNKQIMIVGKGMKSVFGDKYNNVIVYDYAPSLIDILNNAVAFVSPVFFGSGSKIKIAEALMFGKHIIGSKDSFNGYDTTKLDVTICSEASDFVDAINKLDASNTFYEKNRIEFNESHNIDNTLFYYNFDEMFR